MGNTCLVDTHNHLLFGELGEDPVGAWKRAHAAGVKQALLIGIDAESSERTVEFVAGQEGLYASVGVHPNSTGDASEAHWEQIKELARAEKVAALGETGLDLYWKRVDLSVQIAWLERHIGLALEMDLPLVLHVRDALPEIREVLGESTLRYPGLRAVMHCFSGSAADLYPFVEWGWMISFAGNVTYPSAKAIREAAAAVPLGQCLIETDAPWLSPVPHRGKSNEPAFVTLVAEKLAEIRGVSFEEVAEATSTNACRFFRFPLMGTRSSPR